MKVHIYYRILYEVKTSTLQLLLLEFLGYLILLHIILKILFIQNGYGKLPIWRDLVQ